MISKNDVMEWFQGLESYKRIDVMCSLLYMCLPFELRFLGTCLEQLARIDAIDLRTAELRVNNPKDLTSDIIDCQNREPTDMRARRKIALYLALIRGHERCCVAEIYRILDDWGSYDLHSIEDFDTLQELLLIYLMAGKHPIFCFEQQMRFNEIFVRIKDNKLIADPPRATIGSSDVQPSTPQYSPVRSQHSNLEQNVASNLPPATDQEPKQMSHDGTHSMDMIEQPQQSHMNQFFQAAEDNIQQQQQNPTAPFPQEQTLTASKQQSPSSPTTNCQSRQLSNRVYNSGLEDGSSNGWSTLLVQQECSAQLKSTEGSKDSSARMCSPEMTEMQDTGGSSTDGDNQLLKLARGSYARKKHNPCPNGCSSMLKHQQKTPVDGQQYECNSTGSACCRIVDTSNGSISGGANGNSHMTTKYCNKADSNGGNTVGSSRKIAPPKTGNKRKNFKHQQKVQQQPHSKKSFQQQSGFKQASQSKGSKQKKPIHPVNGSSSNTCSTNMHYNSDRQPVQQESIMCSRGMTQDDNANIANCSVANSTMSTNANTGTHMNTHTRAPIGLNIGNVKTAVLQPPLQFPYRTCYPRPNGYLADVAPSRLLTHNPAMARLHTTYPLPAYQQQPNSPIQIYPTYYPIVQPNISAGVVPQSMQVNQTPLDNSPLVSSESVSCYNCGSNVHTGSECVEVSLDDLARNTRCTLDYSVSTAANTSPPPIVTNGMSDSNSKQVTLEQQLPPTPVVPLDVPTDSTSGCVEVDVYAADNGDDEDATLGSHSAQKTND